MLGKLEKESSIHVFTGLDWFYFFLLVILEITLIKQRCGADGQQMFAGLDWFFLLVG